MIDILQIIIILLIGYFICVVNIRRSAENKKTIEKLKEEYKSNNKRNKKAIIMLYVILFTPIAIAIILDTIAINKFNAKFSISQFLFEIVIIFVLECSVVTIFLFIRDMIKDYKKDGIVKTIITFIVTIVGIVGYLYVKYKW